MDKRVFLFLLAASYLWGVEAMNLASMNSGLTASETSRYDLVFVYGVKGNRPDPVNRLDTMRGTFTKDMVMDPPPITFKLKLSDEQMARIMERMTEIGFPNYPMTYAPPMGARRRLRHPLRDVPSQAVQGWGTGEAGAHGHRQGV
jgi:hypothetical protein